MKAMQNLEKRLEKRESTCGAGLGAVVRNQRGVTFMELMISVVIIGIVAAMAAPRFSKSMERSQFRGAAREAVSMLREARSLSITEKIPYGVFVDASTGALTLFKDLEQTTPASFSTADSVIRTDTIPGDYPYVSTSLSAPVVFSANGSASETGDLFLINYSYDGLDASTNYAAINVLASTGRIKLTDLQYY